MARVLMAAAATLAGAGPIAPTRGEMVAYWNFNSYTSGGSLGVLNSILPAQGSGTLSVGAAPTVAFNSNSSGTPNGNVGAFGGSTINGVTGETAGGALAFTGHATNSGAVATTNGGWVQFAISMANRQDLTMSFATRGTSTGFDNNQISWSTDGTTFTNFGSTWSGRPTSFFLVERDFTGIAALNNVASVFVRITFNGATGGAGNNRIDNVQFNANPLVIPLPPAAWAGLATMAGVFGIVTIRRRRHSA